MHFNIRTASLNSIRSGAFSQWSGKGKEVDLYSIHRQYLDH